MKDKVDVLYLLACLWGLVWAGTPVALAQVGASKGSALKPDVQKTTPVPVYLRVGEKQRKVTLVGRTREAVLFVTEDSNVPRELKVEEVEMAHFDEIKIERHTVLDAVRKKDWVTAIHKLFGPISHTLPYLDLKDNNTAQDALDVGDYMMRAAQFSLKSSSTTNDLAMARKQYEEAYKVLREVSKAEWSHIGIIARLKSLKCLLEMGKPKTARYYLEKVTEPVPGDAAYGLYWLLKAELEVERKDFTAAMDAAVKSLCFENKDVDTFPDALLVSARCYEEMQNWHRARDVYYEVACIFPQTGWADLASDRLGFIMDRDLTKEDEKTPVETVFFAIKEDMNKLALEYLKAYREGKGLLPEEEKEEEKEVDLDKPGKDEEPREDVSQGKKPDKKEGKQR